MMGRNYTKKLFVEGNDDMHVVWSLCEKHKIPQNFEVVDSKSIEKVFNNLELFTNEQASSVEAIGIVVDADLDLSKRWTKIKNILAKSGYLNCPDDLPKQGLILNPTQAYKPIVGVWIMPDNNLNGMLEDFVALLADENDNVLSAVDSTLLTIEQNGINRYKAIHKAKARIHTFLAWQEDPGTPMGFAITKRYLNPNAETCTPFISWLNSLFNS